MTAAIRRAGAWLRSSITPVTRRRTGWMLGRHALGIEIQAFRVQLPTIVIAWPVIWRPTPPAPEPELVLVQRHSVGSARPEPTSGG